MAVTPFRGPGLGSRRSGGGSSPPPTDNADAQLVLNKAVKTGFTYFIRML